MAVPVTDAEFGKPGDAVVYLAEQCYLVGRALRAIPLNVLALFYPEVASRRTSGISNLSADVRNGAPSTLFSSLFLTLHSSPRLADQGANLHL